MSMLEQFIELLEFYGGYTCCPEYLLENQNQGDCQKMTLSLYLTACIDPCKIPELINK